MLVVREPLRRYADLLDIETEASVARAQEEGRSHIPVERFAHFFHSDE
jgi:hypothetical protein